MLDLHGSVLPNVDVTIQPPLILSAPNAPGACDGFTGRPSWFETMRKDATFQVDAGGVLIGNCLDVLRRAPDSSVDLVITSPPYDGQPKYGDGEKYDRAWYEGLF